MNDIKSLQGFRGAAVAGLLSLASLWAGVARASAAEAAHDVRRALIADMAEGPSCSPGPLECRPTACTEYDLVVGSGYLYCADSAEYWASDDATADDQLGAFPPGHYAMVAGEPGDQEANLMCFGYADTEY
jgi:hypothetical protein